MEYGFLALVPPIFTIALALITKQTILSLVIGLWLGTTIINGWNPIIAIPKMITDFFIPLIGNTGNAGTLMLMVACGGFVYMIKISGAGKAFGDITSKGIKNRTQAQLVTYFSAFAFIFTEPTLTLGSIMRPITEKFKVSRVKLAYICDVMGCPFATLSPITSYSAYATGLIAAQFAALGIAGNAWMTFVQAIPFNFYAIFGMLALLFVILAKLDIGPMYEAEKRAIETGKLIGENDVPTSKDTTDTEALFKGKNITKANFLVPICTLFITLLAVIMWTGDVRTNGIGGAFMNCQVVLAITTGFITASVAAGIMGAKAGLFNFKDIVGNFSTGVSQQTDVIMILVLAWSMGSLTGMMDLKGYLVHLVEATNLNPGLMPALIFIVGAFVGFSTGSSWGVWAIMMPIGLPIAYQFGIPMEIMIGAVLSGGVFGDHCSPISDTTILASTAAGADHIQHVRTQLPYSLTVGTCAVIGFLVGGLSGVSILGLVTTAVLVVIAFFGLHKFATKKYAPIAE